MKGVAFAFWLAVFLVPAGARIYEAIPGESRLVYRLHHPLHDVKGVSRDFSCTVELDGDTLRPRIHVRAPVSSFNSGNSNRDSHALEAVDALRHPFVEFTADSAAREDEGYRVFGRLTFHGVTRPLDFMVKPEYGKERVRVSGEFRIKLSDYGVKRPSLLMIPTDDELRLEVDVSAKGP